MGTLLGGKRYEETSPFDDDFQTEEDELTAIDDDFVRDEYMSDEE